MPSHMARPHSSCNTRAAESRDFGASCFMVMTSQGVARFSGRSSCQLVVFHCFQGRGKQKSTLISLVIDLGGLGGPFKGI